jgi:hypothetical protein
VALGTDGGGSGRRPPAHTGCRGLQTLLRRHPLRAGLSRTILGNCRAGPHGAHRRRCGGAVRGHRGARSRRPRKHPD